MATFARALTGVVVTGGLEAGVKGGESFGGHRVSFVRGDS